MGGRQGHPRLPVEVEYRFWSQVRGGSGLEEAAAASGVSVTKARRWWGQRGGVMPSASAGQRTRCLCFEEREEIAALLAAGTGVCDIARALGRDPGTIRRESDRVPYNPNDPHRPVYRASTAQADADVKAR